MCETHTPPLRFLACRTLVVHFGPGGECQISDFQPDDFFCAQAGVGGEQRQKLVNRVPGADAGGEAATWSAVSGSCRRLRRFGPLAEKSTPSTGFAVIALWRTA